MGVIVEWGFQGFWGYIVLRMESILGRCFLLAVVLEPWSSHLG